MEEAKKEQWKAKAKEEKMKVRSGMVNNACASSSMAPKPSYVKKPVAKTCSSSKVPKESVFQAWEDLDLSANPEKRRAKDRDDFENAFTWKYDKNEESKSS